MSSWETAEPLRFVVLKSRRLTGDSIRRHIWDLWPDAGVQVFQRGLEALDAIQDSPPALFVSGLTVPDMDGLEHLEPFVNSKMPILIVTSRPDAQAFAMLRRVRYDGVFDEAEEGLDNFPTALRMVMRRQRYVSPSLVEQLKPVKEITLDALTPTQRLVLSVIGDGRDNVSAAEVLKMSEQTVLTHRKAIMRKLKIHHKGDLVKYAFLHGYVLANGHGVLSPGFQRQIDERAKQKQKLAESAADDEAACA